MKRLFKYLVFVLVAVVVFGGMFLVIKNIKVGNIICESQYGECNSRLQSEIANVKKGSIFEVRGEVVKLLKNDKSVLNFSVEFKFPTDLKAEVIQRKAIVAIKNNENYLLVDKDGVITDEVHETTLPKVEPFNLKSDELGYVANLVSSLYTFYGVQNVKMTEEGIIVDNIAGKQVIFPASGDKDVLLGSLALILSRLPRVQEATTIRTIDLRYKNPILK